MHMKTFSYPLLKQEGPKKASQLYNTYIIVVCKVNSEQYGYY